MRPVPLIKAAGRVLVALYIGSLAALLAAAVAYWLASGLGLLSSAWFVWTLAPMLVGVSLVATGGVFVRLNRRARSR